MGCAGTTVLDAWFERFQWQVSQNSGQHRTFGILGLQSASRAITWYRCLPFNPNTYGQSEFPDKFEVLSLMC